MESNQIPINIVISSGGAKGYAAFAIFEKIMEHYAEETNIVEMAGSSVGAILVGIFGKAERREVNKLHQYKEFFSKITKKQLLKLYVPADPRKGLISHSHIKNFFKKQMGINENIEELDTKITIVATRIPDMKPEYFKKGSLIDAIMASISIPAIFPAYSYNGKKYLDGGITDPIPWRAIENKRYAKNIIIDLYGGETNYYKNHYKENIYDNLLISLHTLIEEIAYYSLKEVKRKKNWFVFSPFEKLDVKADSMMDFARFKEIYQIGIEEWETKYEKFDKWLKK